MKRLLENPSQRPAPASAASKTHDCHGRDLRGCPYRGPAVFETKSDRTWKSGTVWIFICRKCAADLLKENADAN